MTFEGHIDLLQFLSSSASLHTVCVYMCERVFVCLWWVVGEGRTGGWGWTEVAANTCNPT